MYLHVILKYVTTVEINFHFSTLFTALCVAMLRGFVVEILKDMFRVSSEMMFTNV